MRFSRRLTNAARLVALASGVLFSATTMPHARAQAQPLATQPPCTPSLASYRGMLPQPPLIAPRQGETITIDVLQGPSPAPNAQQSYCYVREGDTKPFVDAPTIQVRQGETFTMKLIDKLTPASPMPSMAPEPQMTAQDGCALLPYEPPMPPADQAGYLGHSRVYATMAPMLQNDTNFHTHGWHVSPDVDNVFKSLARSQGDACSYTFAVPLSQPAGTYWYHAHLHGLAGQQVGGGLAGALIVLPAVAPTAAPIPDRVVLIKNSTYAVDRAP
jgi:FtsP/CotA-like multicopper oxidase with cupredoxin domain